MMRSLYSGVSGLKTHQIKMDVIGNNIANVNTVGFKSSSVTFQDVMYQTTKSASGANALTGVAGTNATQIGLGVTSGAITTNITADGATQTTGNPLDIKISGDSFFVVNDGTSNYFTRSGAFYIDGSGNLAMTSTGYNVMGWQVDPATGDIKQDTVSALKIMQTKNLTSDPEATTYATIANILDKNSSELSATGSGKSINMNFYDKLGYQYTAKFVITDANTAADDGAFHVKLTDILDSNGNSVVTAANRSDIKVNGTAFYDGTNYTDMDLQYNTTDGSFSYIGATGKTTFDLTFGAASFPNFKDITVDMSGTSSVNNNGTSTIAVKAGNAKDNYSGAGKKLGSMTGITVQPNGMIYATYSNGNNKLLGQIAVANFSNASGLEKMGENIYSSTLNSGEFDGIGQDITANSGSMQTGALEMSNVDLSSEFTEMITTQRGFQANSRIITTSDTLLEELINLKR